MAQLKKKHSDFYYRLRVLNDKIHVFTNIFYNKVPSYQEKWYEKKRRELEDKIQSQQVKFEQEMKLIDKKITKKAQSSRNVFAFEFGKKSKQDDFGTQGLINTLALAGPKHNSVSRRGTFRKAGSSANVLEFRPRRFGSTIGLDRFGGKRSGSRLSGDGNDKGSDKGSRGPLLRGSTMTAQELKFSSPKPKPESKAVERLRRMQTVNAATSIQKEPQGGMSRPMSVDVVKEVDEDAEGQSSVKSESISIKEQSPGSPDSCSLSNTLPIVSKVGTSRPSVSLASPATVNRASMGASPHATLPTPRRTG